MTSSNGRVSGASASIPAPSATCCAPRVRPQQRLPPHRWLRRTGIRSTSEIHRMYPTLNATRSSQSRLTAKSRRYLEVMHPKKEQIPNQTEPEHNLEDRVGDLFCLRLLTQRTLTRENTFAKRHLTPLIYPHAPTDLNVNARHSVMFARHCVHGRQTLFTGGKAWRKTRL